MKKENIIEITPETLSDMLRFAFANGTIFGAGDVGLPYDGYAERRTVALEKSRAEISRVYHIEIPVNS